MQNKSETLRTRLIALIERYNQRVQPDGTEDMSEQDITDMIIATVMEALAQKSMSEIVHLFETFKVAMLKDYQDAQRD